MNFLKSVLWINRRNERGMVELYNSITLFVQLALADHNNNMLNFGYWTQSVTSYIEAQTELCKLVGEFADLQSAEKVINIGSRFCAPTLLWNL